MTMLLLGFVKKTGAAVAAKIGQRSLNGMMPWSGSIFLLCGMAQSQFLCASQSAPANELKNVAEWALMRDETLRSLEQKKKSRVANEQRAELQFSPKLDFKGEAGIEGRVYGEPPRIQPAGQVGVNYQHLLFDRKTDADVTVRKHLTQEIDAQIQLQRQSTISKALKLYIKWRRLAAQITLKQQQHQILSTYTDRNRNRFALGDLTRIAIRQAEVRQLRLYAELTKTQRLFEAAAYELQELLGRLPNTTPRIPWIRTEALQNRSKNRKNGFGHPELELQSALVKTAAARLSSIQAIDSWELSLVGNGNVAVGGTQLSAPYDISFVFRLPLFQGAVGRAERSEAVANKLEQEHILLGLQSTKNIQFQQSLKKLQSAMESIKQFKQIYQIAKESLKDIDEQYQLGAINSLEVLDAQGEVFNAESELLEARFETLGAQIDILEVKGELTLTNLERLVDREGNG